MRTLQPASKTQNCVGKRSVSDRLRRAEGGFGEARDPMTSTRPQRTFRGTIQPPSAEVDDPFLGSIGRDTESRQLCFRELQERHWQLQDH